MPHSPLSQPPSKDTEAGNRSSLGHIPEGRWEFDDSVTSVFPDMLRRSIPQYDVMRQSVFEVASPFVQPGTDIVDLGCSRGDALAPFVETYGRANKYVGVELSKPMLNAVTTRFAEPIAEGLLRVHDLDLRTDYPDCRASLTLCILTLQFLPLEYRQRVLSDAFRHTEPHGALVLVEKVLGATAELSQLMINRYHALKADNGYPQEEIERKRLALEGVLVPVTSQWNEDLLKGAGFSQVDCFWRWMNFAGWVAVRG